MNNSQKIEAIKSEIIKNDPSILDLVFGCKIKYQGVISKIWKIKENGIIEGTNNGNLKREELDKGGIIGRDITLEDVMKYVANADIWEHFELDRQEDYDFFEDLIRQWILGKPLHLQPEPTISYLYDLIVKNK